MITLEWACSKLVYREAVRGLRLDPVISCPPNAAVHHTVSYCVAPFLPPCSPRSPALFTVTSRLGVPQILSMIEEAAGTRLYECKKQVAQKTIEKKDAKLKEINDVSISWLS